MPRFYFNVRTRQHVIADGEGSYLADLASARVEAQDVAAVLIDESIKTLARVDRRDAVEVTDDTGRIVLTLRLGDVMH